MGRLNGAHQFLRTISLTIGIAAVAAITLAVVDRREGDIEAVRGLLSNDPVTIPDGLVDALGDGYATAATAAAAIAAITVLAALHLFRTRRSMNTTHRRRLDHHHRRPDRQVSKSK